MIFISYYNNNIALKKHETPLARKAVESNEIESFLNHTEKWKKNSVDLAHRAKQNMKNQKEEEDEDRKNEGELENKMENRAHKHKHRKIDTTNQKICKKKCNRPKAVFFALNDDNI